MSRKNVEDLTKVTKDQIDSLILYYRKMDEIKRTRFYNFYKKTYFHMKQSISINLERNSMII